MRFFGVNFILQKFCSCKKNDKYEVCLYYFLTHISLTTRVLEFLVNELKIEDCGCFALQLPIEEWQYPGCWWNLESETDISWIPPARRPGHPPYCFEWTSKVQEKNRRCFLKYPHHQIHSSTFMLTYSVTCICVLVMICGYSLKTALGTVLTICSQGE